MEERRATANRASPSAALIGSTGAQMSARSSSQANAPKGYRLKLLSVATTGARAANAPLIIAGFLSL